MNIIIFEDYKSLYPLTLLKPVFEVFHGAYNMLSFFDQFSSLIDGEKLKVFVISSREEILNEVRSRIGSHRIWDSSINNDALIINGRAVINDTLIKLLNEIINNPPSTSKFFLGENDSLVAGYITNDVATILFNIMNGLYNVKDYIKVHGLKVFENIWDYIILNEDLLKQHFIFLKSKLHETEYKNVYTTGSIEIEPSVIFNTKNGPIIIGEKSYIQGPSRIEGPTFISDNVLVTAHANIRRASINSNSIVGGEITNSIIAMNTNSRHQSYIGDSYIGEYVNVGALTVFSNVKNTMGNINIDLYEQKINTGLMKLGSFIGDHVKISVGTTIYGGKIIGASTHIYTKVSKSLPSFVIWIGDKNTAYELEINSAIESAKRFMKSKRRIMSPEYEKLMYSAFEKTRNEREKFGVIKGKATFY
jgi:UDP-N-acetylglucosamine diphosphorylase/glucosamine-1-phosphate N-acetyltransferase